MYKDIDKQILGALVKWIVETLDDEHAGNWMNIDEFGLKDEHLDVAIEHGIIKINRKNQLKFLITDVVIIQNILVHGEAYIEGQKR